MILRFDESTHTYWVDGKRVPSVTEIIAPLYDWSRVDPDVLEAKAMLGTAIHKTCELDVLGKLDETSVHPKLAGYFAAWREFCEVKKPRVLLVERRLHHPTQGYAGTPDLLAKIDGMVWLIDWKSTVALYPQVGVQLAGYVGLIRANFPEYTTIVRGALQLRENGTYKLGRYSNPSDLTTFHGLLAVYNWRARHDQES